MGTLTKAFVILNLVFSIAFVTISATVLSQRTHWKDMYSNLLEKEFKPLKKEKEDLEVKYDIDTRNLRAEIKAEADKVRDLQAEVDRQKQLIEAKDDKIVSLEKERSEAGARNDRIQQILDRTLADHKSTQTALDAERSAHAATRKEKDELTATLLGVRAQLTAAQLDNKELNVKCEAMAEKIKEQKTTLDALAARVPHVVQDVLSTVSGGLGAKRFPPTRIHATVRDVDLRNGILVLNVGSDNEPPVKEGYEFLVYREKNLVAVARVTTVDQGMCAAEIIQEGPDPKLKIRVGDEAMTRY